MLSADSNTDEVKERRKSAAVSVTRWIMEEIIYAPEEHVKVLGDSLSLSLARSKLSQTILTGERIPSDVLFSIDNSRLDNLHMAAMQDPSSADGRIIASRHSIIVSKYLILQHSLIDNDLVEYTVPSETSVTNNSRHDHVSNAQYILDVIENMSIGSMQAVIDVISEPMIKALRKALKIIKKMGKRISTSLAIALENNANQKHFLANAPSISDVSGSTQAYFKAQSEVYRKLATLCRVRGLIAGIAAEPARGRA